MILPSYLAPRSGIGWAHFHQERANNVVAEVAMHVPEEIPQDFGIVGKQIKISEFTPNFLQNAKSVLEFCGCLSHQMLLMFVFVQ